MHRRKPGDVPYDVQQLAVALASPVIGFRADWTAAVTLAGIERAHRFRKRQCNLEPEQWSGGSLKKQRDKALV